MTEVRSPDAAENLFAAVALVELITAWARGQDAVRGLALAGSHARGDAGENSDVDLVFLVDDPDAFKVHDGWPESIPWAGLGSSVARVEDEEYGVAWSRRVRLHPRGEIEFTFARPSWAALDPIDPGTRRVITDGCRILHDSSGALARLCCAVEQELKRHST